MHQRIHAPEALDQRLALWAGGRFDAGQRPHTAHVRGQTRIAQHLVLVTLTGGARRLAVKTDCGHRHVGRDMAGAVSFAPAGCGRSIELEDVAARWGSLALDPAVLSFDGEDVRIRPFTNARDPFAASLVAELDRLHQRDGVIDPAYGEAMSLALGRYLAARYGGAAQPRRDGALPPWKLARVEDYIDAHLDRAVSIAELAALAGLSTGRFHRAFQAATGQTPLRFLQEARVRRATALLGDERNGMIDIAAAVGFASPSHFARVFRSIAGITPSAARSTPRRPRNAAAD